MDGVFREISRGLSPRERVFKLGMWHIKMNELKCYGSKHLCNLVWLVWPYLSLERAKNIEDRAFVEPSRGRCR